MDKDYSWKNEVNLETIFDNHINVPEYQREYSWGSQEADDFFDDLKKFTASGETQYLFGQFIFCKEGDKPLDVIDGQQRLVTTTVFVAVARNIVTKLNVDKDSENYTQFKSWINRVIGSESRDDYKLSISGPASTYFNRNIQRSGEPVNSGIYRATKNLFAVYKVFNDNINADMVKLSDDESKFNYIYTMMESLLQKFYLTTITAKDTSQAFTLFETLNARGKDLEASDLLKNYFIKMDKSIIPDWNEANAIIGDAGESMTQFIRTYWNSKHELVRQRQIWRTLSKSEDLNNKRKISKFVEGLNRLSKYYVQLTNPSTKNEAFNDNKIKQLLIDLNLLGTKLFYPLIIACVEMNAPNDVITKMLESIETLTIRNIILGPDTANKYEVKFSEYAKKISEKEITVEDAIVTIQEWISSDDAFEYDYKNAIVKDTKVSRCILASIYNYESGSQTIINPDPKEVNVEHIMPINTSQWKHISEQDHARYVYYLGNQTLLKATDNTSVSNDPYEIKKETYKKSTIPQTKYFENIDDWGPKQIEDRQAKLFELIKKRWPK